MSEHSELPWRVDGSKIRVRTNRPGNNVLICYVAEQFMSRAEREANAELIVRSVNCHTDLLAACKTAADWQNEESYETDGGGGTRHILSDKVLKQLRAAIAKAESQ